LQGADPGSGAAEKAAGALRSIAYGSDTRANAVVAAEAVPALVRVLQGADPGSDAAEHAAGALKEIAYGSEARRDALVVAGAVPALLHAVGDGTVAGSDARKEAVMALFSVAGSSKGKSALRDTHGAVAKLQAAKAKFSGDVGLVKKITNVLERL